MGLRCFAFASLAPLALAVLAPSSAWAGGAAQPGAAPAVARAEQADPTDRVDPDARAERAAAVDRTAEVRRADEGTWNADVDRAVLAYRAGDFETARALFLEALARDPRPAGRERARLLYALGNVSARQGAWREAVGWYEASLRLRPRDADTWANLELARSRAGFEPADRGDLSSTVARLLGLVTPAESRLLVLLGILALALGLGFEALRGGPAGRRLAFAGALFLLCTAAPWLRHLAADGRDPHLVIAEAPLPVLSEPRPDAARIGELRPDQRVEALGTFLEWTRVRSIDGATGWVPSRAVFGLER